MNDQDVIKYLEDLSKVLEKKGPSVSYGDFMLEIEKQCSISIVVKTIKEQSTKQ